MTVCSSRLQVFGIFRDQKVSVDVVATSEISISLTLDPRRAAALTRLPQTGLHACRTAVFKPVACKYIILVLQGLQRPSVIVHSSTWGRSATE